MAKWKSGIDKMYEPFNKKPSNKAVITEIIMNSIGAVSILACTYMMWAIICGMGGL